MATFDTLTSTMGDITRLLNHGKISSVDLLNAYTSQIERHNHRGAKLHAMISVVPENILLDIATRLDTERAQGKIRSPLHGIPFAVKDTIWTETSFGVPTTAGTFALSKTLARENADIVQLLVDAGMIMLGKANLSELGGAKGSQNSIAGCSAAGGKTQSAYVVGGVVPEDSWMGHSNPGGSSSGSAVAVAAGMTPVALGSEADGSLVLPSDRASLYSIRLSPGSVSPRGTLPFNSVSDSLGPMTKSPEDAALMLSILLGRGDFTQHLTKSVVGLKIGFLDPVVWAPYPAAVKPNEDYTKQYLSEFNAAVDKIEAAGAVVSRNVTLRRFGPEEDKLFASTTWRDYYNGFADFTAGLIDPPVRTLKDLIAFNNQHCDEAMPEGTGCASQDFLEATLKNARLLTDEQQDEHGKTLRLISKVLGLDSAFEKYDLEIIAGAPTGRSASVYDTAGYPIGTLPLGYASFNGRPFGMAATARKGREDLIIRLMSAWEELFGPRLPPPRLATAAASP
ncbi:amidase signature domain-containing protein [Cladorrhinum sp. PSN332]|nr:amidase signature domain-containing protein [Cladorrhinum sp. PSN332]